MDNEIKTKNIFSLFSLPTGQAILLMTTSIIINVLTLTTPLILMQIYDRIIAHENKSTLIILITGGVVSILLESTLRYFREKVLTRLTSGEEYSLSVIILKKILNSEGMNFKASKLTEAIESIAQIRQIKINDSLNAFFDLPFLFFYLITLYFLSQNVAIFNTIIIVTTIAAMIFFTLRESNNKQKWLNLKANELELQTEVILKRDIVKINSFEKLLSKKYWNLKGDLQSYNHKEKIFSTTVTAAAQALSLACLLGTVLIGAHEATKGNITIGGLTACTLISGKIMQPIFSFIRYLIRLPEVKLRTKEIDKLLDLKQRSEDLDKTLSKEDITLAIQGLTIEKDEKVIYDTLKFRFEPKTIYLLDKFNTTEIEELYKAVTNNHDSNCAQNIYMNGTPLEKMSEREIKKNIFTIPKEGDFFNGSVLDNISLFSDNKKLSEICATLVSLDSYYNFLSDGYETILNTENLETLPVSILQRIQIARALYFRPKILFIDKIDQDMDQETRILFKNILQKLKNEMTIVTATDLNYDTSFFDYRLTTKEGKIRIEV